MYIKYYNTCSFQDNKTEHIFALTATKVSLIWKNIYVCYMMAQN